MAFDIEGIIYIPMVDVWEFIGKNIPEEKVEDIAMLKNELYFNFKEESLMVVEQETENHHRLDLATFWEFVYQYAPCDAGRAEFQFGFPTTKGDFSEDLQIPFAASTYTHPSDWGDKSERHKQWENLNELLSKK